MAQKKVCNISAQLAKTDKGTDELLLNKKCGACSRAPN